jgi:dTDP-4-dehydrorhamnose 3,5-epimerase
VAVLISPLKIAGSWQIDTTVFGDARGEFVEWFKAPVLAEMTGYDFSLAQANLSRSSRGSLRGVHFADVPPGQAKYITCPFGTILDFIVDIRVGSPTFGQWEALEVSAQKRNAVFLEEGLGHAFLALEDDTVVTYLVTDVFKPEREHGINPLDADLGLEFPFSVSELELSEKDTQAPGLSEAAAQGLLPLWAGGTR